MTHFHDAIINKKLIRTNKKVFFFQKNDLKKFNFIKLTLINDTNAPFGLFPQFFILRSSLRYEQTMKNCGLVSVGTIDDKGLYCAQRIIIRSLPQQLV